MLRQYELVERVAAYDPSVDEAILNQAYVFAVKAHGTQTRASGDPYFSHPVEVAGILTDLRLDHRTIVAALLHDTVEDTQVTLTEIGELFGPDIARMVDGVTKLTKLELISEQTKQAENFRKLLVAMAQDVRVLLVKLADRLHNMRTLHFIAKQDRRTRIAQETLEIFAPLAGLIGMQDFRDEMEDLAFKELNPGARDSIVRRLKFLQSESGDLIDRIVVLLKEKLAANNIEAKVLGRAKKPYSIYRKMERKSISFEQLADIFGFRIIVPSIEDCYRALGIFHSSWPTIPGRFKDYISTPKRNDYRSIHTTVIGPEEQRVELQIRTEDMDLVAEQGLAAHWKYKDAADPVAGAGPADPEESRAFRALRQLVDMIEHGAGPQELLENTKLEMVFDQVFCFTPKGDLFGLPRGATPIDFAYAVHTELGDTCVGVKINGHYRPLSTQLSNGDMIEVICNKAQTPRAEWENFVITGKARAAIRRHVRQSQRERLAKLGRGIAEKIFEQYECAFSDKAIESALPRLKRDRVEDVYVAVGEGELSAKVLLETVYPGIEFSREDGKVKKTTSKQVPLRARSDKPAPIPLRGIVDGQVVRMSECCHPIPGDRIVGILSAGEGAAVHTIDCEILSNYHDAPEKWLDLSWETGEDMGYVPIGRIRILMKNVPGALGTVSHIVAEHGANIDNLTITDRDPLHFEMLLDLEIVDAKHLTQIITTLRASEVVENVRRSRGQAMQEAIKAMDVQEEKKEGARA